MTDYNYEYAEEELEKFKIPELRQIAKSYKLKITNLRKKEIISEISLYQKVLKIFSLQPEIKLTKFNLLPNDLLRLISEYLEPCDIINFCRLNKRSYTNICQNDKFLVHLGHKYLTAHDDRLPKTEYILERIHETRNISDASSYGYEKKLEYLYHKNKQIPGSFHDALIPAVKSGYLDIVKYLSPVNLSGHKLDKSALKYALDIAIKYDHLNVVKYLVSQGANIHDTDEAALRITSLYGHLDIIKYLVEQGADVHADDDQSLVFAAEHGYLPIVQYLVEHKANIHGQDDAALRYAASNNHLDVVRYLLSQGADIHTRNDYALREASRKSHSKITEYLLSVGGFSPEILEKYK